VREDVAVYRNAGVPPHPSTSRFEIVPILAGEVASRGNTTTDIEEKTEDYGRAGVPVIVSCFPHRGRVWLDGAGRDRIVLTEDDVLDVSDVLPGSAPIPAARLCR
jgi:hypothetical protein